MFDGVAGTTAVTLTANRTAAAAPIPIAARVEPERGEQREAGEQLHRPRRRAGRAAARRRGAGRGRRRGPVRTLSSAPRIAAITRATRPVPLWRTSGRREQHRDQQQQRREAEQEEPLRARVEEIGRGDDDHAEQDQGDDVEHASARPACRAGPGRSRASARCAGRATIARAGSPRRAGRVADIRTPTIVAEVTSRRRSGPAAAAPPGDRVPGAPRARTSRRSSARWRPGPRSRSERTMLVDDLVDADPLRGDEGEAEPEHAGDAEREPPRDPVAACRRAAGAGSSEGRRRAGSRGEPSAGREPEPGRPARPRSPAAGASWPRS